MFALSHDYRVMRSDRGFICLNEVDLGAPLTPGMAQLIAAKVLQPSVYRNLLLQGHRYKADEALANQLVDAVAPNVDETIAVAKQLATRLSAKTKANSYGLLKQEMYRSVSDTLLKAELGLVKTGKPKL